MKSELACTVRIASVLVRKKDLFPHYCRTPPPLSPSIFTLTPIFTQPAAKNLFPYMESMLAMQAEVSIHFPLINLLTVTKTFISGDH